MTAGSKRWVAIGGTALMIVGAGAYMARATLFPPQDAADRLLAEMKQTPEQQRFEQMRVMREKAEKLSEAERDKLREGMRGMFEEQMDTRIAEYENASEDQKVAILDKQIDEMIARRKEWEKRRAEREAEGAQGGQQPGNGAGTPPAAGRRAARVVVAARSRSGSASSARRAATPTAMCAASGIFGRCGSVRRSAAWTWGAVRGEDREAPAEALVAVPAAERAEVAGGSGRGWDSGK